MPRFDLESYDQVKDRIKKFRADHPEYGLRSEIVTLDSERVVMHGWIEDRERFIIADGHAEEIRGSSPVNQTSPLENCETSAWGRCLAAMGYAPDKSIASREEMAKAGRAESRSEQAEPGTTPPAPPAEPWMATKAQVDAFIATGTAGYEGRREQLIAQLSELGLPLDLAKATEEQLAAIEQVVSGLTEPF